jgi:tRNA pseudouridine32 synthase / 23S rRNA pseudouridine746 synthase
MPTLHVSSDHYFTKFTSDVSRCALPEKFTFPFCYEPHPLSKLAAKELQQYLLTQTKWRHNFGLPGNLSSGSGKMFGVLVVKNSKGDLGYIAAFSGKLADTNTLEHFVPPVFDMLDTDGFFLKEQLTINEINQQIEQLSNNPKIPEYQARLEESERRAEQLIASQRDAVIAGRKSRKLRREQTKQNSTEEAFEALQQELAKESVFEKNQLKALRVHCAEQIQTAQQLLCSLTDEINTLKEQRKSRSTALQHWLFEQYRFLNIQGREQNLEDLFANMPHPPPAGAGDCAAPKLLQYAFKHQLTPIALAEFWWGVPPKSEIRQHQNFYPACQGKCQPILSHMLDGITLEDNPLLDQLATEKKLEIVFEDEHIAIVNKPPELLSVPGKHIEDSVYHRMKLLYPKATGNLIVHRLDMSTSGLMVIALSKRAHKSLQKQFINHTINKRYVAKVSGNVVNDEGLINLPLTGDYYDRPRQMVCFESGKPAETRWQVISRKNNTTTLYLYPKTGRTHQLRMHCAHSLGLNMPIIGDDLYGTRNERLHLHAQRLELDHPITKIRMSFEVNAAF